MSTGSLSLPRLISTMTVLPLGSEGEQVEPVVDAGDVDLATDDQQRLSENLGVRLDPRLQVAFLKMLLAECRVGDLRQFIAVYFPEHRLSPSSVFQANTVTIPMLRASNLRHR